MRNKYRSRKGTGRSRASTVADSLLSHIPGAPEGKLLVRLWRHWEDAVGPELAEWAHPLGSHQGTLRIGVDDAMGINELVFYGPQILYDVHQFLGQELFDNVQGELLMGRIPLDAKPAAPAPPPLPTPESLGGLGAPAALATLGKGDTPWAKAYRAYVKLVTGKDIS